jgi:predicted acyl esterase
MSPPHIGARCAAATGADSAEARDPLEWVPQNLPADTVEYTSEPFADGAMLAGPLAAQLQVTSSNSNLQLFVEVFDRAAAGTLTKIGFGSILGAESSAR